MKAVVISSGHGLHIRGASGYSSATPWGLDEVDEVRKMVEQVATVLRGMGVSVTIFHDNTSSDQSTNLETICAAHNNAGPHDLDVSMHLNCYNQSAHGCEVEYLTQKSMAQKVAQAIVAVTGLTLRGDGGAVYRSDLYVLNHTNAPAILIETLFCDNHSDTDIYRAKFSAICTAIAEGISGKKAQPGVPQPPHPPPLEFTLAPGEHLVVKQGDSGADVAELQRALGCLIADGEFGPTTDTWVRAFQAASDLTADGVVGEATWNAVDDLVERVETEKPPLPKALVDKIWTMAATSEIADYPWPDRGIAPTGYIAGMAMCFAYALRRGDDDAVIIMSEAQGDPDDDALAWLKDEFAKIGMNNNKTGAETLRHLFVLIAGLGMRESSGRYCEGRDLSASNVQAETAESGLLQTSWNIQSFSPAIGPLLDDFWDNPNGFLPQFREGITATTNNLNSYGSGDGVRYQFLARFAPLFTILVSGVGLRVAKSHWGPVQRKEVTLKKEMDDLLKQVQALIKSIA